MVISIESAIIGELVELIVEIVVVSSQVKAVEKLSLKRVAISESEHTEEPSEVHKQFSNARKYLCSKINAFPKCFWSRLHTLQLY